jgi:hypothetical protein
MQRSTAKKGSRSPKTNIGYIRINALIHKKLTIPLDVIVEPDADGFIARAVDLPLYGFGDDPFEALTVLKKEIETLHHELMTDNQFTPDWHRIKEFLLRAVGE